MDEATGSIACSGTSAPKHVPVLDLVRYFLRLGTLGFGGPAALCGQMERELVGEKGWLTRTEMREAIAVSQSLPGPLAIQVGIFAAYLRGGVAGALAGGWAFILPNFVIVALLGALYVHFGDLPWMTGVFYGVAPVVIALIVHSCWRLAKMGVDVRLQWAIAAAAFLITVVLKAEVALVFVGAGVFGVLWYGSLLRKPQTLAGLAVAPAAIGAPHAGAAGVIGKLILFFLKAGSLTFGSGLVIVPFLEKGLVQQTGWITQRDFLIAVAVGMLSPGPVVITATFVGFVVAGFWG
jgi:chromate transporter